MAQFASAMEGLNRQGVEVERYELSSRPDAFASNELVKATLEAEGVECLPLIMLNGEIVSKGSYLDKDTFSAKVGIEITSKEMTSCCGPSEEGAQVNLKEADACCG